MGGIGNIVKSKATGESVVKPKYKVQFNALNTFLSYEGTGEIWLEPSWGYYSFVNLNNETVVIDKGLFLAAESSVEVGIFVQKNTSTAVFGGEGLFQTKMKGSGNFILSHLLYKYFYRVVRDKYFISSHRNSKNNT
jgi:uncharacterized protein (AIM24 family)